MASQEQWTAVDRYFTDRLHAPDPVLEAALADSAEAGLPEIQVTPTQGKFLHLIARSCSAKRILEIGTLGGYSTIWLARALPAGGRMVTLELDPRHADVAKKNFARAGIAQVVDLRLGRAIETLPKLATEEPFDLIFIDADKQSTADYFSWAMKLARPGGLIVVDNVVRKGKITETDSADDDVKGIQRFTELLAKEKRASATVVQTVGVKGYDGFVLAVVAEK